jgi:hypothetical protein
MDIIRQVLVQCVHIGIPLIETVFSSILLPLRGAYGFLMPFITLTLDTARKLIEIYSL